MTPERKAEIRELLTNATPGPWEVNDEHACLIVTAASLGGSYPMANEIVTVDGNVTDGQDERNAKLIAAAPTITAELLAEVDDLTQKERISHELHEAAVTAHDEVAIKCNHLKEENRRLREALGKVKEFMRHKTRCGLISSQRGQPLGTECTCGLEAALTSEEG